MISHTGKFLLTLIGLLFLISCSKEKTPDKIVSLPDTNNVPQSAWKSLEKKKIFFGHQSVGFNIVEGIRNVMKENTWINLNIVYDIFTKDLDSPALLHYRIGHNGDYMSKMNNFADVMTKNSNNKIDIAFFKFCYIDVTYNNDIELIINTYKTRMLALKKYARKQPSSM
jgi:hypothetical protein